MKEEKKLKSTKNDVIGQYIESKYEEIKGEEQLNELTKKVKIILVKLINDNFLCETKNENAHDNPLVYINNNYDTPYIFDV